MLTTVERLSRWYAAQCNGDWEHSFGVKIDTLDNPGWSVTIDLAGTQLAERDFPSLTDGEPGATGEWVACGKEGATFNADCSPQSLDRVLRIFLEWAEADGAG